MKHIHLQEIPSTNTYLRGLLAKGQNLEPYTIVTTDHQTAGRGQKGNHWESEAGQNITLSMLIRPTLTGGATLFDLSIAAALATREVIDRAVEGKAKVMVKWPNDLLIDERKIAGILIENEFSGSDLEFCIIGLGLNVAQEQFGNYQPQATSIALERTLRGLRARPTELDKWHAQLLEEFANEVKRRLEQIDTDLKELRAEYHQYLYRNGIRGCCYHTADGHDFQGTLQKVEPSGMLVISDDKTGAIYRFAFKEVQFSFGV